MADRIPTPEDIEHTLRDSGPLTLRALCRALWPGVSWRTALRVPRTWPGGVQASLADWLAAQLRTRLEHHAVQMRAIARLHHPLAPLGRVPEEALIELSLRARARGNLKDFNATLEAHGHADE
mgnify:CR=1 FL=1